MPLTELVTFEARLKRWSRIQVPVHCRWRYRMEPGELLEVTIKPIDSENYIKESFLAKMTCDGRLTVPKLIVEIIKQSEEKDLTGCVLEVKISPLEASNDAAPPEPWETSMLGKIKDIKKSLG